MSRPSRRAVPTADGWRVLLPPGWVTLPTEPEAARSAVSAYLDRVFAGTPRDELVRLRIELDQALRHQAAGAARAGASHVHALAEPVRGLPVSAAMVSVPVATGDPEELAAALSAVLGDDPAVVEHGHTALGDLPALRRVRREQVTLGEPVAGAAPGEHTATHVDYVVPVSEESVLLLTFSTTTEPVWRELVVLFDAVAATLHRPAGQRSVGQLEPGAGAARG